jgi:hypothetical protein
MSKVVGTSNQPFLAQCRYTQIVSAESDAQGQEQESRGFLNE